MSDLQHQVDQLIQKATDAVDSGDALRFSQAALNAAHTQHALQKLDRSDTQATGVSD